MIDVKNLFRNYGSVGFVMTTLVYAVLSGCAPQSSTDDEISAIEKARLDSIAKVNDRRCRIWLSTGFEYFKNKDFEGSLRNYTNMIDGDCAEKYGDRLWIYLGNSYRELDMADSAMWAFKMGLSQQPDNISLHENVAFLFQMTGENEKVIESYETIASLDSANVQRWRKLHDLYFRSELYEKDLITLQKIIDLDPTDIVAKNDIVTVIKLMGGDATELLEERVKDNPGNTEFLLEYANAIYEVGDYEKAVGLYEQVTTAEPEHMLALDRIASCYKNLDKTDDALKALKTILKIRGNDKNLLYDIAEIYKIGGQIQTAYSWANKTIAATPKDGRGYYIRGLVLEEAANFCQNERGAKVASIYDKLVYELALDDVKESVRLGFGGARSRMEYLTQIAPSTSDLFMHPDKFAPEGDCYKWIKRKVKRK